MFDIEMDENDADADTVGEYLIALAKQACKEYVIKRPFGNSGWYDELALAFDEAGLIDIPEDGYYDPSALENLIDKTWDQIKECCLG